MYELNQLPQSLNLGDRETSNLTRRITVASLGNPERANSSSPSPLRNDEIESSSICVSMGPNIDNSQEGLAEDIVVELFDESQCSKSLPLFFT
jgi:hypothetical protein